MCVCVLCCCARFVSTHNFIATAPLLWSLTGCTAQKHEFYIKFCVSHAFAQQRRKRPGGVSLQDSLLECDQQLSTLLSEHRRTVDALLRASHSVNAFFGELRELLVAARALALPHRPADALRNTSQAKLVQTLPASVPECTYYGRLLQEIELVGWQHIVKLSNALDQLELCVECVGAWLLCC